MHTIIRRNFQKSYDSKRINFTMTMMMSVLQKKNVLGISLLLVVLISSTALAQRYPFYNVTIENGLIQSQSRDLAQDKMGHLWIATLGGLSRFDGKTFNNYTVRDGLPSNTIGAVEVDKDGMIWVGSMSGLSKFDGKTFRHFLLQSPEDPSSNSVSRIKVAADGTTWCISGGKVFRVANNKAQQKHRNTHALASPTPPQCQQTTKHDVGRQN